jgi:hypothetical protein
MEVESPRKGLVPSQVPEAGPGAPANRNQFLFSADGWDDFLETRVSHNLLCGFLNTHRDL